MNVGPVVQRIRKNTVGSKVDIEYKAMMPQDEWQIVTTSASAVVTIKFTVPGFLKRMCFDSDRGDDTITVSALGLVPADVELCVNSGQGNDSVSATGLVFADATGLMIDLGIGNDTFTGSGNNEWIADGLGNDMINAGTGNDTYTLTPGSADVLTDSGGTDTLDFSLAERAIFIDMDSAAAQTVMQVAHTVQLVGQFENFIGSAYNDTITAKALAVPRSIDGGPEVIGLPPGDQLTVNAQGKSAHDYGTKVSIVGFADISYTEIESLTLTNVGPPTVAGVQINDGSAQRSMITSLLVTFTQSVTLLANAFTLIRQAGSAPVTLAASIVPGAPTAVTLTFIGGAVNNISLSDGRYTLTIAASKVSNVNGMLDGDGNGVAGDNHVLASAAMPNPPTNIFRIFGDSDGDGTVAANDFIQFRLALGGSNPTFDFDNDGAVAASDFIQFRLRFGGSI